MNNASKNLKQKKTALITGAAARIGRAIALSLVDQGYAIALHHRSSEEDALTLQSEIESMGGQCSILQGDLADTSVPVRLIDEATEAFGLPLTLLVNNASIFEDDNAENFTADSWDRHQAVNLRAPALLSQAFFHRVPEAFPCNIVNLIDHRVLKLNPLFFSYTASKAGLWTITRTMAQAYAPYVRVNAIGPGPTLRNIHQKDGEFEEECAKVPLERGPELSEITRAIQFILETPSLTGQMLTLDGGQHLAWRTDDIIED